MSEDKIKKYKEQIEKTGYILEYQVSEILSKHKWNVINNRYYVDDVTENVREIDIVAYKATSINKIYYYTALLISCKKSEENDWVFLSKKADKLDPNLDYLPISNWTNERHIDYMLKHSDWKKKLINITRSQEFLSNIYNIDKKIFAFQEMKKSNGAPQNDKKIFDSITTLIKALAFELSSLTERKQFQSFYNFNLISIAQTDLIEMFFDKSEIGGTEVKNINYINRFIVGGKDEFFKVNFVEYDYFEKILCDFDDLHLWNNKFYSELRKDFFNDIVMDKEKINYQYSECRIELLNLINFISSVSYNDENEINEVYIYYDGKELTLDLDKPSGIVSKLNTDKSLNSHVKRLLKEYFNYEGKFRFVEETLPF